MHNQRVDEVREAVRQTYAQVAEASAGGGNGPGCCGGAPAIQPTAAESLGYARQDVESVPEGAEMGLGCGNPQVIAALKAGKRCWIWAAVADSTASSPPARWGTAVA